MSEVAMFQDLRFLSEKANLPCFEHVLSQVIKHLYKSERCTYSDLEQQLADDFKIGDSFHKEDLKEEISEFKNEIYWVCKYLKLIQFIQLDPEGPVSISSKGMDFLSRCPPEESQLKDISYLVRIKDYFAFFDFELDPIVIPYSKFIEFSNEKKAKTTLTSFFCSNDSDIQDFIRNKMERFEDRSICRSYLILDRKNSEDENFYILGFFVLALKILTIDQDKLTRRQKKDMNLLRDQDGIPSYFIAQLGKNDMFKYNFKGKHLLDEAVNIVYECMEMLGGTIVWLEANKEADYVVNFYKNYGFIELQSEVQEDEVERIQLVKYLNTE
jgi:hypothetical protein